MTERKLIKNIRNLGILLDKNRDGIKQFVVSEDFMITLGKYPNEIEIDSTMVTEYKEHDFQKFHCSYTDEGEIWLLWGVPITLSQHIKRDAMLIMHNDDIIRINGIYSS